MYVHDVCTPVPIMFVDIYIHIIIYLSRYSSLSLSVRCTKVVSVFYPFSGPSIRPSKLIHTHPYTQYIYILYFYTYYMPLSYVDNYIITTRLQTILSIRRYFTYYYSIVLCTGRLTKCMPRYFSPIVII